MTTRLILVVALAVVPMIAAGFLWPAGWPLLPRQIAISLWGTGVILTAERRRSSRSWTETLRALGWVRPRAATMAIVLVCAFVLTLGPVALATHTGRPWGLQAGWGLTLLGVILVNGLSEEVIHRAYLFRHLRERHEFWHATAIAAAIFAAQHLYLVVSIGPVPGVAATALALLLTVAFIAFYEHGNRSLLPTGLLHTATNAPVMLLLTPVDQQMLLVPHMVIVLSTLYAGAATLALIRPTAGPTAAKG